MSKHKTIGLDLAKNSFYFVVLNEFGKRITRKKLNRMQVLPYLANLEQSVIAIEACSSAHYWGREIRKLGHKVQLLPPQHVKGYLRGQKNDYNDAQAIAEASQHGAIRTVEIKTIGQQDRQSILHMRRLLNVERTRLINHMRGLLSEYGIVLAQRAATVRSEVPRILEDAENELTDVFRQFLNRQYLRLLDIEKS